MPAAPSIHLPSVQSSVVLIARALLLVLLAQGCAEPAGSESLPPGLARALEGDFPETLAELGVVDAQNPTGFQEPATEYTPRFPLWSNGSDKSRARVADGPGDEAMPGDLFLKTFSFEGRVVETRLLLVTETEPEYATYLWNEVGDAAVRLDGSRPTEVEVSAGGEALVHEVPSHRQCAGCHEAAEQPALGYDARQLSGELGDAVADGDREVVAYALGNCVHCHNGRGVQGTSYSMEPDVFRENNVGKRTTSSASADGLRVAPGDPEASVLFRGLSRGGDGAEDMPSLGVQRRDEAAVLLFREWIEGLEE